MDLVYLSVVTILVISCTKKHIELYSARHCPGRERDSLMSGGVFFDERWSIPLGAAQVGKKIAWHFGYVIL